MCSATQPLIMRTLARPVNRELPARMGTGAKELDAAREALLDTRDAADKVIDSVVDRLLKN